MISDTQMAALAITRHGWHGDWNYTLHPEQPGQITAAAEATAAHKPGARDLSRLFHPAITGMPTAEWDDLLTRLTVPREA